MDEYRIDTKELWYYILYPIILIASLGPLYGFETLIAMYIQYLAPSIDMQDSLVVHGLSTAIMLGVIIGIIAFIPTGYIVKEYPFVILQFLGAIGVATALYIAVINLNNFFYPKYQSIGTATTALTNEESIVNNLTIKIATDATDLSTAKDAVAAAKAVVDIDLSKLSKTAPNENNPAYSDYDIATNYQTLLENARPLGIDAVYTAAKQVTLPSGADVQKAFTDIMTLVTAEVTQDIAQATYNADTAALAAAKAAIPTNISNLVTATRRSNLYEPVTEGFADGSILNETLTKVQQVTQGLQKSLDTLSTATDDTCSVMRGIEKRFLDNVTAPEGDGTPPSPAEAKEIKAQKLPGAKKQWSQKKQDWSATHGQISMIECFTDGSLSELIAANQQLTDLLASAPVQRVVAQVKSLQTSAMFSQSYIDQLVAKLNGEAFTNLDPTPEDTIATSRKLIAKAMDVQASITKILDSTSTLKKNYAVLDAKSNDPNTVNNLAGNKL